MATNLDDQPLTPGYVIGCQRAHVRERVAGIPQPADEPGESIPAVGQDGPAKSASASASVSYEPSFLAPAAGGFERHSGTWERALARVT
jgi:hypothetical protein